MNNLALVCTFLDHLFTVLTSLFFCFCLEVLVTPDNGGWVYTDNNWKNPRTPNSNNNKQSEQSVTRRRRWVRKCACNLKKEQ